MWMENKPYRNGVLDVKILLIESIKFHDISFYIAAAVGLQLEFSIILGLTVPIILY